MHVALAVQLWVAILDKVVCSDKLRCNTGKGTPVTAELVGCTWVDRMTGDLAWRWGLTEPGPERLEHVHSNKLCCNRGSFSCVTTKLV